MADMPRVSSGQQIKAGHASLIVDLRTLESDRPLSSLARETVNSLEGVTVT